MNLFLVLLIAVSLSMDTFSLSLAYGTLGMERKAKFILSLIVGLFHFFMPILGMMVGNIIMDYIRIDFEILASLILSFIGVQMILSSFKDEEVKSLSGASYFLFALAVSIDSFSVGITLNDSNLFGPFVFAIMSFLFTMLGLFLGDRAYKMFGKISTIIGGIILIGISVFYSLWY